MEWDTEMDLFGTDGVKKRHTVKHRQQAFDTPGVFSSAEAEAEALILRSVSVVLVALGFQGAEQAAMMMFSNVVHNYLEKVTESVAESMLSARRTLPAPADFHAALDRQNCLLVDLVPHLDVRIPASVTQRALPFPQALEPEPVDVRILDGDTEETSQTHIPAHFPKLPSQHAYKKTPVYTGRETDPQKMRELAAEEGQLGEQTLRAFVGTANKIEKENRAAGIASGESAAKIQRRNLWEDVMTAFKGDADEAMEDANEEWLSTGPVNADARHFRKGGAMQRVGFQSDQAADDGTVLTF